MADYNKANTKKIKAYYDIYVLFCWHVVWWLACFAFFIQWTMRCQAKQRKNRSGASMGQKLQEMLRWTGSPHRFSSIPRVLADPKKTPKGCYDCCQGANRIENPVAFWSLGKQSKPSLWFPWFNQSRPRESRVELQLKDKSLSLSAQKQVQPGGISETQSSETPLPAFERHHIIWRLAIGQKPNTPTHQKASDLGEKTHTQQARHVPAIHHASPTTQGIGTVKPPCLPLLAGIGSP